MARSGSGIRELRADELGTGRQHSWTYQAEHEETGRRRYFTSDEIGDLKWIIQFKILKAWGWRITLLPRDVTELDQGRNGTVMKKVLDI